MRLALVTYRFPWPVHTGDRVRALRWLHAMLPLGNVTLIAPAGQIPAPYGAMDHLVVRRSHLALLRSLAGAVSRGLPLHTVAAGALDWHGALARAHSQDPFDAAVVLLSRCDPWIGSLRARFRVMDAIDASSLSMLMRARTARGPVAAFWRREHRLATRLERSFESNYDRVMVASARETALLGPGTIAVNSGVQLEPTGDGARDFDFGFWGRLNYFVNREALETLLGVLWPAIRRELPHATLLIAGADVPRFVRTAHGNHGITVVSPMADRTALLRRISVAIFPLRHGTGVSNKLLEAAEASCAIVGAPEAFSGVEDLREAALVGGSDDELIEACIALRRDPARCRSIGDQLRGIVVSRHDAAHAEELLRGIVRRGSSS